ncbi:MAG: hypothetical protein AAF688_15310 [Bacteroidota bacterium]
MKPTQVIRALIVILAILYLYFAIVGEDMNSVGFRGLSIILLASLYVSKVENRNKFFLSFLLVYALGDLFGLVTWFTNINKSERLDLIYYYVGNCIYISSYLLLSLRILSSLNLKLIIKNYLHYVALLILISISCIYFISDATIEYIDTSAFLLESIYNIVIIILMSLALLGYLTHDDKKSINLLIASILIVLSEILQLAYFYVAELNFLNIICAFLFALAFLFFYLQSRLEYRTPIEYTYEV